MAKKNYVGEKLLTPVFRLAFANGVFEAKVHQNSTGKPKFSAAMLFDEDADLSKLKAAAQDCVKNQWGKKKPKRLKSPFKDQGDYEYEGYIDGNTLMNCTSTRKPQVTEIVNGAFVPILDTSELYSGCYCKATVVPAAYEGESMAPGVTFYLNNIIKVADGEPLAGGSSAESDFEDLLEDEDFNSKTTDEEGDEPEEDPFA